MASKTEMAIFGGGCFWCTEAVFSRLKGVTKVTPGYGGGKADQPTYEQVSAGDTGHAEVIKIEFDPDQINYRDLLEIFWHTHDPTTANRQGADIGSQYRSLILYTSPSQKDQAEKMKLALEKSGEFKKPLVTEIKALEHFYTAEDYHQKYYDNHRESPYCQLIIDPKLAKLEAQFSAKLKT